mgnify:CR=1 FL=1
MFIYFWCLGEHKKGLKAGELAETSAMDELADIVEPSDNQKLAGQQDFAPEVWRSIKLASIRGVSDKDLEAAFGVKAGTIAVRRHRDEEWTAACKTRVNLGQPNKVKVAENVALLVQENAAQISERNLLLGSKLRSEEHTS